MLSTGRSRSPLHSFSKDRGECSRVVFHRSGENPTWKDSSQRRRHSFRQRITELAAQRIHRATSFKDTSSPKSFNARLCRSENRSAEPFGRVWTSNHRRGHYCIILCEAIIGRSLRRLCRLPFFLAKVHRFFGGISIQCTLRCNDLRLRDQPCLSRQFTASDVPSLHQSNHA